MTSAAFRARLARLRWSQRSLAALLGVTHNTVHRWALDQAVIPADVAAWLDEVAAFLRTHPPPRRGLAPPPRYHLTPKGTH
jgi:transcriptional regulator with XRE-family HTH domain